MTRDRTRCAWPTDGTVPSSGWNHHNDTWPECGLPVGDFYVSTGGIVLWSLPVCNDHLVVAKRHGWDAFLLDPVGEEEIEDELVEMVHGPRTLPAGLRQPRGFVNGVAGCVGVAAAVTATVGYGCFVTARTIWRFYTAP